MVTTMKKFVVVFAFCVTSLLLVSCSKTKVCRCTHYYNDGSYSEGLFNPDAENVKSCSQLEYKLNTIYGDGSYSCFKL